MNEPEEVVDVELTPDERKVLWSGLHEWGGPARCSEELAVAMGFQSVSDLFEDGGRIRDQLERREPLTRTDWTRALLATEIVFASNILGSGTDWSITTGLADAATISTLRGVQVKLGRARAITYVGTRPTRPA